MPTAQAIIDRIRRECGAGWRESGIDAVVAGRPEAEVRGVATAYAPSLEVLEKAVASGRNMIVSLESPFWTRPDAMIPGMTSPTGTQDGPPGYRPLAAPPAPAAPGRPEFRDDDPVLVAKRNYIAANNLVVYRFIDNWTARQPDPVLQALVGALGWGRSYRPAQGAPWATHGAAFVEIPPATLRATARVVKQRLKIGAIRIIGDPDMRVSKAAVSHGNALLVDLERYFAEPGVDLVLIGEAIWENEGMQYVADLVASGQKKGLILLGQEPSREPGCEAMAAWLRSFVLEVPVAWIPTGDARWAPATSRGGNA